MLRAGLACLGLAIVAEVLPMLTDQYTQYIVNLVLIYMVVSTGLNLLLGYSGQFAFANAALMGVGAYAYAIMLRAWAVPVWLALPAAGVLAASIGSLAAIPALRMKSVYLALVTLAFAELTGWVLLHWAAVTGGSDGLSVPKPIVFGLRLAGDHSIFYLNLAVTAIMLVLARLLLASPLGRAFVAVRENEIVAQCNGIDIVTTKLAVFAVSAFFAGIGGGLYAITIGFLQPDTFGMTQMILQFSIVVIGGSSNLLGPVVGSVILTVLPEALRDVRGAQEIAYGVLLMGFVLFVPSGLAGLLTRWRVLPREILVRNWRHAARRMRTGG